MMEAMIHPSFCDLAPHVVAKFWKYHADNPHVFEAIRDYCVYMKNGGHKRYGIGAIIEGLRWHTDIKTIGEDFKLGNNHRSCYARLMVIIHPEFSAFFETRHSPGLSLDRKNMDLSLQSVD